MAVPLSVTAYLLLFLAGLAGGFIDAIAGGGGLITLPALLTAGLPPGLALGTNKLQSACGTTLAVIRYGRAGLMTTPWMWLAVACAFFASMAGVRALTYLDQEQLKRLIPWLLAGVSVYTACNRRFGIHLGEQRMKPVIFAVLFGIVIGFYDGFFGPGTGSFWTLGLVTLLGLELRGATGYTKAANLASNVGSLFLFIPGGQVHFQVAGAMIAGQLIGARLGSGLVITKGAAFIRPVFLGVVFLLTLKLIWSAWHG
ncbi:MAG: hypothetical protein JWO82_4182 [Akkermansiaceae bacterium]|nr:hypothetical protein [Akkermansiaceae bacterium]